MQGSGGQRGERHRGSGGLQEAQEREHDGVRGGDAPEMKLKRWMGVRP